MKENYLLYFPLIQHKSKRIFVCMPFFIMTLSREKFSHAQEVRHLTFWQREQQLVCNKLLTQYEQ